MNTSSTVPGASDSKENEMNRSTEPTSGIGGTARAAPVALTEFERGRIQGLIEGGGDAPRLAGLLQMVLDDIKICRAEHAENGGDWTPIDLSAETVEALDAAYKAAMTPCSQQTI